MEFVTNMVFLGMIATLFGIAIYTIIRIVLVNRLLARDDNPDLRR